MSSPGTGLPAAILLDQDGTLVDSEPVWERAERGVAASLGGVLTAEHRRHMVGAPLSETIRIIREVSPATDLPDDVLGRELVERVAGILRSDPIRWIRPAVDLLARCRESGARSALVTSSYRLITDVVGPRIPGGVDLVVAGDDVARPKPAPDAFLEAARRLDVPISRCLVVEDSASGVSAGLASGARVVAIPNQLPIAARPGLSRVCSADELDDAALRRVMSGGVVDTVPVDWSPTPA